MNADPIKILLIEDDPDYAELVQQWLADLGEEDKFVLSWADSLAGGLNRITAGDLDVILLDLGLPDSNGIETFSAVKTRAPGIPTIVLSAADSEALAIEMVQQGAQDYLVKSNCTPESLVKAVRFAIVRHLLQAKKDGTEFADRTRFLGLVGAKGGVGTTTLACLLAAELRRQTDQKVLLVDLDVPAGFASFLMGINPQFSMADAITNLHRLDSSCWDAIVSHGPDDVDMIASVAGFTAGPPADDIRRVLNSIQSFYPWIVLDFGRLNGLFMSLIDRLSEILIVTNPSISSLFGCKRVIDEIVQAGVDREQLRLIVNQTEDTLSLSGSELSMIFGIQVFGRLPRDTAELHTACIQRRLPSPASNLRKQAASLARLIIGVNNGKSEWKVPQLFSFMGRFLKNTGHPSGSLIHQ
jgi:Flp pilus assembly CpaE family ATPase